MKVNFGCQIADIDGKPMKENEKAVTVGICCTNALLAVYQDEPLLEGTSKVKRFQLAMVTTKEEVSELSVEDVAEIKRLVGKAFAPLIVGRCFAVLEGEKDE